MDIFAHMIWANYGTRPINKKLIKKDKKPISAKWAMFWSVFPDFFAFGTTMFIAAMSIIFSSTLTFKLLISSRGDILHPFITQLPPLLYQFSHSIIIWLLFFIITWIIWKKPQLVLLGWALHIFIDIFSHSADFYPTPFLFPISDWVFSYGIRWSNPYFMIVNYSLIVIFAIYFYLTRERKIKS